MSLFFSRLRAHLSAFLIFLAGVALLLGTLTEFVLANRQILFGSRKDDNPEIDLSLDLSSELPSYRVSASPEDGVYTLSPGSGTTASLSFEGIPGGLFSLSFDIAYTNPDAEDNTPPVLLRVQCTDPRTTWSGGGFITIVSNEPVKVGKGESYLSKTVYTSVEKTGEGALTLTFQNLKGDVRIRNLKLNAPPQMTFHVSRMLLLSLLIFLAIGIPATGLSKIRYDAENPRHRYGMLSSVLLCVLIALVFSSAFVKATAPISYPLSNPVSAYNPYIQQFDAFQKGQLELDITPSDALLEVENPYDYASRKNASPLWDRAFYDGKYYSYFGIAPLLAVYYPFYLLTGNLPGDGFVLAAFLLISAVFTPLCVLSFADLHEKKKIPLPLLFVGALTAFLGSNMLLVARGVSRFYYIAVLSGNAFLSLFLFLLLSAAKAKSRKRRLLSLILAGVSYVFLLWSRIQMALLAAFVVLPFLFFRILKREKESSGMRSLENSPASSWKDRLKNLTKGFRSARECFPDLFALGLPVCIGFAVTFWMNAARFGSIFEFGTSYQLTVSDIRYSHVSLSDLFPAIWHYFLQSPQKSAVFPYFQLKAESLNSYGHFVYVDSGMGLFSLPVTRALLFSPAFYALKKRTAYEKTLLSFSLFGILTVALLDFSLGGVIFRYTADLTLFASLLSVFLLFAFYRAVADPKDGPTASEPVTEPSSGVASAAHCALLLFFLFSIAVCFLLSVSQNGNLAPYDASLFVSMRDFFTFR